MNEILNVIPPNFRPLLQTYLAKNTLEEIRFRCGQVVSVVESTEETPLSSEIVSSGHLDYILARASDFSLHAVQDQIARGFLSIQGGHRLGLCGTAVMEQGTLQTLRNISSISLRIAKEYPGISRKILPQLFSPQGMDHCLILSPPGKGKTTLLRDIIRSLSNGQAVPPQRVALLDERSEIAGIQHGIPRFDLGVRTDVLNACPKSLGMMFLVRSMNPQILAVDEITAKEDVDALEQVAGCGVCLLVTAHGRGKEDLFLRPNYKRLMNLGIFKKLVSISTKQGHRHYSVEVLS